MGLKSKQKLDCSNKKNIMSPVVQGLLKKCNETEGKIPVMNSEFFDLLKETHNCLNCGVMNKIYMAMRELDGSVIKTSKGNFFFGYHHDYVEKKHCYSLIK